MAVLALAAAPAWAGRPTEEIRHSAEQVLAILQDPALKGDDRARERRIALSRVAEQAFDFAETAKLALGHYWRDRTDTERAEFAELFKELVERTYVNLLEARGGYKGEKVLYVGESIDGDYATVRTKIVSPRGPDVPMDYRMLRTGDRWLVYDVAVEGVSLVGNYRTQFNSLLRTSSYPELLRRIKARVEELQREETLRAHKK